MPIIEMAVRERPRQSVQGETAGHLYIIIDILRIIVVNEAVTQGLAEDQPCNRRQEDTNDNDGEWSLPELMAENPRHSEISL